MKHFFFQKLRDKRWCNNFFIMRIGLVLVLLCIGLILQAQQTSQHEIELHTLLEFLEEKHNVSVFFRDEDISTRTYSEDLKEYNLEAILTHIATRNQLKYVRTGNDIFLLPEEMDLPKDYGVKAKKGQIIIGNPSDYGRYERALIQGQILDGATSEPLIGAGVFEPERAVGSTTDLKGAFELELPVGEYRLVFSYMGYQDRYQDILLISNGQLDMALFSSMTQLLEVTIMARKADQNITQTQMSQLTMDSYTLSEIPTSFGERDIVRSFTLLPGIQSVGEFGAGFNVRGGSADQNLFLIENAPLFNPSHLFGLISVINPDLVSNVSLLKAGIPAKYGERASSVMEVRLQDGHEHDRFAVKGGVGLLNSRLLVQTPLLENHASLSVAARSSYSDWYIKRLPDEDLLNSEAGFYDLTAFANVDINASNRISVFAYYSQDRFSFSEDADYSYSNTLASLRWNRFINARWDYTMIYSLSEYDYSVADKPRFRAYDHRMVNSLINYQSLKGLFNYQISEMHLLEFGASAIAYRIDPGNQRPLGLDSQMQREVMDREQAFELSLFGSANIHLGEKLALEGGLRYTHYLNVGESKVYLYDTDFAMSDGIIIDSLNFSKNDVAKTWHGLEPRLGLRYIINDISSAKFSYNRNYQYIHLISNTAVMAPTDVWKLSDYHIQPLQSDQLALGYFRNFLDNTLETSLEAYYKKLRNEMYFKSGAVAAMNNFPEQDITTTRGHNYGIELYVNKTQGMITGWTSYTYSSSLRKTQAEFEQDRINDNSFFPTDYDRPHNLVLNLNYHPMQRWRLSATFSYSTGRPVTLPEAVYPYGSEILINYSNRNKYRLPDYHRLDISLALGESKKLNRGARGSWTISVMNVYGRKNPYSVFYRRDESSRGQTRSFNLYQLYIISRPLPTITYNFSF